MRMRLITVGYLNLINVIIFMRLMRQNGNIFSLTVKQKAYTLM